MYLPIYEKFAYSISDIRREWQGRFPSRSPFSSICAPCSPRDLFSSISAIFLFLYLPIPFSSLSPLSFSLSFSPYAKFLRTLVAERERVYRSIAERPRSRLLLLLEVRSWLAGFFLPPSLSSAQFSLLFLVTRRDATRCRQHLSAAATSRAACRSSTRRCVCLIDEL